MNENQYQLLEIIIKKKKVDYLLLASLMPYGLKIWNNEITRYNLGTFLERDDGVTLVYKTFNQVIKEFIEFKLDPCLFLAKFGTKVRQDTFNFIRSFRTQGHYILNNSTAPSDKEMVTIYNHNYNHDIFIENIYECFDSELDKKIISMKIKGYTNNEIANSLNINSKKVENNLYLIRKKMENSNMKKKLLIE